MFGVETLGIPGREHHTKALYITEILCTYNRCHSMSKTLNSVAASLLTAPVELEVLTETDILELGPKNVPTSDAKKRFSLITQCRQPYDVS